MRNLSTRIDERLLGLARQMGYTEGVVEDLLMGFRAGGLADVVDLAIVAVEHHGHPLLAGELVAQAHPAQVDTLGLEPDAQGPGGRPTPR